MSKFMYYLGWIELVFVGILGISMMLTVGKVETSLYIKGSVVVTIGLALGIWQVRKNRGWRDGRS